MGLQKYTDVKPCVDAIISEWKIIKSLDDLSRSLSQNKQLRQDSKKILRTFQLNAKDIGIHSLGVSNCVCKLADLVLSTSFTTQNATGYNIAGLCIFR